MSNDTDTEIRRFDLTALLIGLAMLLCLTAIIVTSIATGWINGHMAEVVIVCGLLTTAGSGLLAHRYAARALPEPAPGEVVSARVSASSGENSRAAVLGRLAQPSSDRDFRPRILLVEDDDDSRTALARLLDSHGFRVSQAADGIEALNVLHRENLPDLILLDLVLPRMNGYEFYALLQEDKTLSKIPVILCSGEPGLTANARRMGCAGAVEKPIDADRLFQAIKNALQ